MARLDTSDSTWVPTHALRQWATLVDPQVAKKLGRYSIADCIHLAVVNSGTLAEEPESPRYQGHFTLLGLFDLRPLYRDNRTGETLHIAHRFNLKPAAVERKLPSSVQCRP